MKEMSINSIYVKLDDVTEAITKHGGLRGDCLRALYKLPRVENAELLEESLISYIITVNILLSLNPTGEAYSKAQELLEEHSKILELLYTKVKKRLNNYYLKKFGDSLNIGKDKPEWGR